MIADLTGLDIANASMLDRATAAAQGHDPNAPGHPWLVAPAGRRLDLFPQTAAVLATRARTAGHLDRHPPTTALRPADGEFFRVIAGAEPVAGLPTGPEAGPEQMTPVTCWRWGRGPASACALIAPARRDRPTMAFGSAQRFGVRWDSAYAGCLAVHLSTSILPGRLVGVSGTAMAPRRNRLSLLQTRRTSGRDKATICTAQVLLGDGRRRCLPRRRGPDRHRDPGAWPRCALAAGLTGQRGRGGARHVLRHRARARARPPRFSTPPPARAVSTSGASTTAAMCRCPATRATTDEHVASSRAFGGGTGGRLRRPRTGKARASGILTHPAFNSTGPRRRDDALPALSGPTRTWHWTAP